MKNIFNKNSTGIIFASLLLAAGTFFVGSAATASTRQGNPLSHATTMADCEPNMLTVHIAANCELNAPTANTAGDCEMVRRLDKKANPADNALMPCCLERQDNVATTIPATLRDRIKFSESAIVAEADLPLIPTQQKTYLSSKSPPIKVDKLSSVVKIE